MIKRTVEISQRPVHLTVRDRQLLLLEKTDPPRPLPADPPGLLARIPCEDVGLLLVEHAGTTYTHAALTTLLECSAAVVVCGRDHLPAGLLLPLGEHSQVVWRIHDQVALRGPLRKRLWRQIVVAKVRAQARNLRHDAAARSKLLTLARGVRSGDPVNVEAQAARVYWSAYFGDGFRRDPDAGGLNALLNYGYAVVRAAVARAVVAAGLLPALGIHHSNRSNAFCLADDLIEPLRPLVDEVVRGVPAAPEPELTPETKALLLALLTREVRTAGQCGPLLVALHRYAASLAGCLAGEATRLQIPSAADPPAPAEDDGPPCS